MTENPNSSCPGLDAVEEEFFETLRQAAYIFEKEENGRFLGPIFACKAVARFIYQRGRGAELAGPFMQIATAFEERQRGGNPRLFVKKSVPEKERERSPERKHTQMLAAAALEVLVKLTPRGAGIWDDHTRKREANADMIARHVNKWPGMGAQQVTGQTVIAWRNQQRSLDSGDRKPFDTLVEKILAEPNPDKTVMELLQSGPLGLWKS
jgi:hypothetical protein